MDAETKRSAPGFPEKEGAARDNGKQAGPAQRRRVGLASSLETILSGSLRGFEFLIVLGAGSLAYILRHDAVPPTSYQLAMLIGAVLAVYFMQVARLYDFRLLRDVTGQVGPLTTSWLGVTLTLIAAAFFTKTSEDFSRIWGGLWLLGSFVGFIVARVWVASLIAHWQNSGRLVTQTAVVGTPDFARRLARLIGTKEALGIKVLGLFRGPGASAQAADPDAPLADFEHLLAMIRSNQVDQVILAFAGDDTGLRASLDRLKELPVPVRLCPGPTVLDVPSLQFSDVSGVPVLNVYDQPFRGWSRVFKLLEDRIGGAILTVLVLPLALLIALVVKITSPGPVLFRQKRYGFNNNEITVLKFRTMYIESDEGRGSDLKQATRGDPRVTPFGRFLRRTSLDEIPQLWNVLRGDMSLVGPRPHAVPHNKYYARLIGEYLSRHRVKPGITGWAQVNGFRGETETTEQMHKRVEYDLYYIENWSPFLDLKILFLTPFVGLVHKNAY